MVHFFDNMTRCCAAHVATTLLLLLAVGCDLSPDDRNVWLIDTEPFIVEETSLQDGAADVPLNQPITLRFNRYLDPSSFEYHNAVVVESGGIRATGFSRYRIWDRSLTFYPTRNLLPELIYEISVNPKTVRSIEGYELTVDFSASFETAREGTVEQDRDIPIRSYATDVLPIFNAHCSCHDGSDELVSLEYDQLLEQPSRSIPDRLLVRPTFPEDSYLLAKLLPDYTDRLWTIMPPEWAEADPLALSQIQIVEEWIATGAGP